MYPLFETIRLKDGELQNLIYHQARLNRTMNAFYINPRIYQLDELIKVPDVSLEGIYKCRFIYSDKDFKIEYELYKPKKVRYLQLIEDDSIIYNHKFTDRSQFDKLISHTDYDDVIITSRGAITDTSRANIVFLSAGEWFTTDAPLLKGTQRAKLLQQGRITERAIKVEDLGKYKAFRLINAMCPFEEQRMHSINNIII